MSDSDAERTLGPGAKFGRYTIVRRIGRGGMGAVYEGIHEELQKRVAIKALMPSVAENPEVRARFVREGQSAARIRHPHVVDIYDVGVLNEITYLVMEYLEGEDLNSLLKRSGALSITDTVELLLPVLSAISAAHDEGVIHRDLKPANIFLAKGRYGDSTPKVLDFGISKLLFQDPLSDGLTQTGTVLGTPFYMSPEQALGGKAVDARTDQYSLAVIAYQCLTGKRPFEADSMYSVLHRIVQGEFTTMREIRPEVPDELEDVVLTAMAKTPGDRFADVQSFGCALVAFGGDRTRAVWGTQFPPAEMPDEAKKTELRPRPGAFAETHAALDPPRIRSEGARPLVEPVSLTQTMNRPSAPPSTGEASVVAPRARVSKLLVLIGGLVLFMLSGVALGFMLYDGAGKVVIAPETPEARSLEGAPAAAAVPPVAPAPAAPAAPDPAAAVPPAPATPAAAKAEPEAENPRPAEAEPEPPSAKRSSGKSAASPPAPPAPTEPKKKSPKAADVIKGSNNAPIIE